jgi:hypothetical protein
MAQRVLGTAATAYSARTIDAYDAKTEQTQILVSVVTFGSHRQRKKTKKWNMRSRSNER